MRAEKHHEATDDFDGVGDEHHAALGHQIGKNSHPGRQENVADDEKEF